MALPAGLYIRRSYADGSEFSPEAQERQCRLYAELQQYQVYQVYLDDDFSGRTGERPAFEQMLKDARMGRIKVVVVHKLDRFARNAALLLQTVDKLLSYGCNFVSVSEQLDFASPMGRMVLTTLAGVAEYHSNNLATEVRKGLHEKAAQGGWVGPVPLGYEREGRTLKPTMDAVTVVLMYTLYAGGVHSDRTIADELNGRGLTALHWRSKLRQSFSRETVRGILLNPAYVGITRCSGKEYLGAHPPLVDKQLWERVQELRQTRDRKGGRISVQTPRGLLTDIAYCARCGGAMWQITCGRKHDTLYYQCSTHHQRRGSCDMRLVRADSVEGQALNVVRALSIPAHIRDAVLFEVQRRIRQDVPTKGGIDRAKIQEQLRRLKAAYFAGDDDLDDVTYARERARLQKYLSDEPAPSPRVLDMQHAIKLLSDTGALIDAASLDQRRSLLRQLFTAVWLEHREIKAITPTSLVAPLVEVVVNLQEQEIGSDAENRCPMGLGRPFYASIPPRWAAFMGQ